MVDESTTISNVTSLIVYIRMLDPSCTPSNSFLKLCELCGTTGEDIASKLLESLMTVGITVNILQNRLMGFCTDGASNLHGCVKGALKIFADKIHRTDMVNFHCMNHKLELAVHDAVTSTNKVSTLTLCLLTLCMLTIPGHHEIVAY